MKGVGGGAILRRDRTRGLPRGLGSCLLRLKRPKSSSGWAAIAAMMAITTITIRTSTKKRLSDYKWGDRTYDEVLSMLMDRVPLEDISREQIREHYRRLEAFKGVPKEEFKAKVRRISRA